MPNLQVQRTVLARGRVFGIRVEHRQALGDLKWYWEYALTEFTGPGVSYYMGRGGFITLFDAWGSAMTQIDDIVRDVTADAVP